MRGTLDVMRPLCLVLPILFLVPTAARADTTCLDAPYRQVATADHATLSDLADRLRHAVADFPSLRDTLDAARPRLCLSDRMDGALAYYTPEGNRIVLDRGVPPALGTGVLVHELRHLWQIDTGACPTDDLAMREYARATFALEADASAVSLLVAWTLRDRGEPAVWDALASWPSQADIARSFETTMAETGEAPRAVTSAFYQWFASAERRETYYLATCGAYLDRQDADHMVPRYNLIPSDFYQSLCKLPDGRGYSCGTPDDGQN